MKHIFLHSLFLLTLLNANEISSQIQKEIQSDLMTISTDAKDNQCSISINNKIIYQRTCEFEYNPSLIFYARLQNWNDVWVFQDTPMGNACDGGILRIFERKNGEKEISYRGEIDFCGGPNPSFELKGNTLKIIDEYSGKSHYLQKGQLGKINENGTLYHFK
ncbi:hypothetical protein OQH61_06590 [Helicobacter sp. MIT 21-1697]|uniref:hypothetical protein n=1 Tax=Helicobacter sp. MIT 21-1697 TaxID=2993733 RepID=UPI00224B0751|nr:hypothetical protein [Helicobacter sp. MIT 21-1697]MCX2717398.1 hypothetical protein [Helicobacter sp. MIT 21-1697]